MKTNAHVFISYSRKNIEFAKRLFTELNKSDRDVWVDWEDIPRAADWMQEIYNGIDNADTFIFLVSEHSLISEICNRELAYALDRNKKIIPLILQDMQGQVFEQVEARWQQTEWVQMARKNWEALKHLNWVFFNDVAKYDQEFNALMKTVDQDLYHIKTHTRLLVRAQEWLNAQKNPSSLLAGDDIISAEHWLTLYADADPQPTALHRDYIRASRDHENERIAHENRLQNRARIRLQILVGSFVILILVIILGLLPNINNQLEDQLEIDIDDRLREAAYSFRDLLDEDEGLAFVSARFVADLEVMDFIGVDDDLVRRTLDDVRDDFGLQEISIYDASFAWGGEPVYYRGPEIRHNDRVQREREELVVLALEQGDDFSDLVIGSPESQIIATSPIIEEGRIIGVVLVAYHINDEYIEGIGNLLTVDAVLVNLEEQVVATTISNGLQMQDDLNSYQDTYDFYANPDEEIFFDFIEEDGEILRMVNIPLDFDGELLGYLFVADSFEAVLALQGDIQQTVFIFAGIILGVVVVLLVVLIGIPALQNRQRQMA